jgi:hypothetical protein
MTLYIPRSRNLLPLELASIGLAYSTGKVWPELISRAKHIFIQATVENFIAHMRLHNLCSSRNAVRIMKLKPTSWNSKQPAMKKWRMRTNFLRISSSVRRRFANLKKRIKNLEKTVASKRYSITVLWKWSYQCPLKLWYLPNYTASHPEIICLDTDSENIKSYIRYLAGNYAGTDDFYYPPRNVCIHNCF